MKSKARALCAIATETRRQYYAAYDPDVNHIAMAIRLLNVSLGHDDEPATHSLLVDRQEAAACVGAYDEVCRLLQTQHPPPRPPTPADVEEMNRYLAEMERDKDKMAR